MWTLTIHYYDGEVVTEKFGMFVDIQNYLDNFASKRFIHMTVTAPSFNFPPKRIEEKVISCKHCDYETASGPVMKLHLKVYHHILTNYEVHTIRKSGGQ